MKQLICYLILAVGVTASALLVYRQKRIDTANEMLRVHRRLLDHEQTLWKLRRDIATQCHPEKLRRAMERIAEEWAPLPALPEIPVFPATNVAFDEEWLPEHEAQGG